MGQIEDKDKNQDIEDEEAIASAGGGDDALDAVESNEQEQGQSPIPTNTSSNDASSPPPAVEKEKPSEESPDAGTEFSDFSSLKTKTLSNSNDTFDTEQPSQFRFNNLSADYDDHDYSADMSSRKDRTMSSGSLPRSSTDPSSTELLRLLVRGGTQQFEREDEAGVDDTEINQALKRRLRDFRLAQKRRRDKYGQQHPWGIIGLYDHLSGIRTDVEWAEDAAWRRENEEPYLSWADFEDAKDTGLNRPFFTYSIMVICTICLIISIGLNGWKVERFSVNPMIGPSADTLVDMGAKQTSLIVEKHQWFRLITPMVMHAGIIHYFINMLALWFIGYAVEQSHGFVAAFVMFVLPAVGGTIISALFLPEYISVGASGGIFGLIGACLADIFSNWNLLFSKEVNNEDEETRFRHIKVLLWLSLDVLLNILIGLTPFVDNFTHMGGMVYGFLCGLSFMERLSKAFFGMKTECFSRFQAIFMKFFGIILSLLFIIITLAILANSDGMPTTCRGCRFVSCVPFPFWESYDNKWWYCDDCDMVTAEGDPDKDTEYFASMDLTCPDGAVEFIDLSGEQFTSIDKDWLGKQLPTYCRKHCDSLYAN